MITPKYYGNIPTNIRKISVTVIINISILYNLKQPLILIFVAFVQNELFTKNSLLNLFEYTKFLLPHIFHIY